MKTEILDQHHGVVRSHVTVRIPAKPADMVVLRAALAVVDKYEKKAMKVAGASRKDADFVMVSYAVKTDCLEARVDFGSCG